MTDRKAKFSGVAKSRVSGGLYLGEETAGAWVSVIKEMSPIDIVGFNKAIERRAGYLGAGFFDGLAPVVVVSSVSMQTAGKVQRPYPTSLVGQ